MFNNIRMMLVYIFVDTQDKSIMEKMFYYWKRYVDAEETAFGSSSSVKSDVIALAEKLEKAGYSEDAAFYRKKAKKLEQEN